MRRLLAALLLAASVSAAKADETASCAQFDWPLETEKAWLAAPDLQTVESGKSFGSFGSSAFSLELKPLAAAALPKPPERAPADANAMAGFVTFATLAKAGMVQVTLADEAWIGKIQSDAYLKAAAHTGKRGCPGLRKSVRFAVKSDGLTLQVSGADKPEIGIAVRWPE